jgi:hypothetical protein
MSSSDDETIETARARLTDEANTNLEKRRQNGKFLQKLVDACDESSSDFSYNLSESDN